MFESLAKALAAGLSIWEHKDKLKYSEKLASLKRAHRDEINKPRNRRSNAVLDNLEFELRLLVDSFSAAVGKQDT